MTDRNAHADGLTRSAETAHGALRDLDDAIATGAPVPQSAVNTLRKVLTDLGDLATAERKRASDEAQAESDARASQEQPRSTAPSGSAAPSGSGSSSSKG